MKSKLELPKTLRLLESSEAPRDLAVLERIKLSKTANIVEGYTLFQNDPNSEFAFKFFAEININNSRLWDLFLSLCDELPTEASLIFNVVDGDPNYGEYTEKFEILDFLKDYKTEIVLDTLMEIGMIFHTENELIEVFIADCKYIKFWGVNESSFLKIMESFSLKKVEDIKFIDEYPKVRESLFISENDVKKPEEFMKILDEKFQFV
ncbi:hypothetical protein [Kordia sp.]|uniref:hypothetical protein n=1 Tax=Kordia sp. TaxID=1965332 RepID=UPI003B59B8F4